MKVNESMMDRAIRTALAIVLLILGLFTHVPVAWLWDIVGIVALLTGLSGYCPLYQLFGIATNHPRTKTS
ncbi:MAG: DUF2892 domain-containing protein [Firmicutes bacterium]|nr:DUF2892 domain-containing protein [Bacillota bacterium]